jgi:hypothetical protein
LLRGIVLARSLPLMIVVRGNDGCGRVLIEKRVLHFAEPPSDEDLSLGTPERRLSAGVLGEVEKRVLHSAEESRSVQDDKS